MSSVETQPDAKPAHHRRVGINFVSLLGSNILQRILGLASGVYIRRTLQVTAIGQVNWCGSVISYFGLLVNPGLEWIAQREVAKDYSQAARYVSLTFAIEMLTAVCSVALVVGVSMLHLRGPVVNTLLILQALNLLFTPPDVGWLLYARERMIVVALSELAQQVFQILCFFALIHDPSHIYRYVLIPYPTRLAASIFRAWYASRHGLLNLRDLRFSLAGAASLFKEAAPLGLSQVAITLYYNCDAILLGWYKGDAAVGIYATAYGLMLVPLALSGSLVSAYTPTLARSTENSTTFHKIGRELVETLCWFGLPMAALGWATGRGAVELMYGAGFKESGPVFEILCLNVAFIFFSVGVGQPLIAQGHQKRLFFATASGAVVNLGLNLWLIPIYGIWAAVWTTILAEFTVGVCVCTMQEGASPLSYAKQAISPLITALLVGFVAHFGITELHLPWWACAAFGGTISAICALRFGRSEFISKIARRVSSSLGIRAGWLRPELQTDSGD